MDMGSSRKRQRDYCEGWIEKDGVRVCDKVFGTYVGYLDFDNQRLFDVRAMDNYELIDLPLGSQDPYCLVSDSRKRIDLTELFKGNSEVAQENKTTLEVLQRKDRKLREQAAKRRENGGKKIVYHFENP